jgi:hypothetical protein
MQERWLIHVSQSHFSPTDRLRTIGLERRLQVRETNSVIPFLIPDRVGKIVFPLRHRLPASNPSGRLAAPIDFAYHDRKAGLHCMLTSELYRWTALTFRGRHASGHSHDALSSKAMSLDRPFIDRGMVPG